MSNVMVPKPRVGRPHGALLTVGQSAVRSYGMATANWRPDPDLLVIGAKRGGSTSFYYDLLGHPQMCPLFPRPKYLPKQQETKGAHYFDQHFHRGERWYRSYLPSTFTRRRMEKRIQLPVLTGEASPYYLFHPCAPGRAADLLPTVKLIAVLRDPVMRTYSHWKERRREGFESLDFVDALAAEEDRLGVDEELLTQGIIDYSYAHEQQSYRAQSEYDTALQRWLAHFPSEQLLVLSSEDYYRDPDGQLGIAQDFLGMKLTGLSSGKVRNAADGAKLDSTVRDRLAAHFAPHNDRLEKLTGRQFRWG